MDCTFLLVSYHASSFIEYETSAWFTVLRNNHTYVAPTSVGGGGNVCYLRSLRLVTVFQLRISWSLYPQKQGILVNLSAYFLISPLI